jgi:hypothetical protein
MQAHELSLQRSRPRRRRSCGSAGLGDSSNPLPSYRPAFADPEFLLCDALRLDGHFVNPMLTGRQKIPLARFRWYAAWSFCFGQPVGGCLNLQHARRLE